VPKPERPQPTRVSPRTGPSCQSADDPLTRHALERYPLASEPARPYGKEVALVSAFNNLGVALQQLRRYREAEAAYREAIRIDPGSTARNNLASLPRR
jgi:tetratricopeptide (TPR) repeat protein